MKNLDGLFKNSLVLGMETSALLTGRMNVRAFRYLAKTLFFLLARVTSCSGQVEVQVIGAVRGTEHVPGCWKVTDNLCQRSK